MIGKECLIIGTVCCGLLASCSALAQAPGGDSATQAAANAVQQPDISADPSFRAQSLRLVSPPPTRGPVKQLFNGRNLAGWDVWLGFPDANKTYLSDAGAPIGLNKDKDGVFSVVKEDGQPAIYVTGKTWGALITRQRYANYHLHAEFKWGANKWVPGFERNTGFVYNSHGAYGAFFGTFMPGIEFELVPGVSGMMIPVPGIKDFTNVTAAGPVTEGTTEIGSDPTLPAPHRRYMLGGRPAPLAIGANNVAPATDADKPVGEWNTIDLYVFGDSAVHVVNGVPVAVARGLTTAAKIGAKPQPLTGGRIQFQSEGSDAFLRNVTIQPITALPKVVAVP